MPRNSLTPQAVRIAKCPPNRVNIDLFDANQKGFLLEVRISGDKTFYQRYIDVPGRQRQFKIG